MTPASTASRSSISRRGFLVGVAAAGVVAGCSADSSTEPAASSPPTSGADLTAPDLAADPFLLGVASGDPLSDAVVLWTRLVGADEPIGAVDVPVQWVVATDDTFENVVAEGTAVASARFAHSVHEDVDGLESATTYWYRFEVAGYLSPTGRTRTAPAPGTSPGEIRLAVASCQAYQSGYYTSYRHMAGEDLDVVLFLGDYIYEVEASVEVRPHGMEPPASLDEFRAFYDITKRDADLQAAHAAFPWIVTWDDHEVEDNYAGLAAGQLGTDRQATVDGGFPAIRAAAYQAWWEHMAVRAGPPDDQGGLRIYRSFTFGDLITAPVVDTRQYRSEQPRGEGAGALPRAFGGGPQLPGAFDPDATMLGGEQEEWLFEVFEESGAIWNVLLQQSVMAEVDRAPQESDGRYSMDSWDGYVVPRQRILDFVADRQVQNFVSIGADIHTSAVTDLRLDPKDVDSEMIGTEFITPSITSLELLLPEFVEGALANEHILLYDTEKRGYLVLTFTPEAMTAEYRYTVTTERDAPQVVGTMWQVEAGTPGAALIEEG